MSESSIPLCNHQKANGVLCSSPALRGLDYCYFHEHWRRTRPRFRGAPPQSGGPPLSGASFAGQGGSVQGGAVLNFPLLEDANAVQLALQQVMQAIIANQLDPKRAGLLLYALQTASINLKHCHFESYKLQEQYRAGDGLDYPDDEDDEAEDSEEQDEDDEEEGDEGEESEQEEAQANEGTGQEENEEEKGEREKVATRATAPRELATAQRAAGAPHVPGVGTCGNVPPDSLAVAKAVATVVKKAATREAATTALANKKKSAATARLKGKSQKPNAKGQKPIANSQSPTANPCSSALISGEMKLQPEQDYIIEDENLIRTIRSLAGLT